MKKNQTGIILGVVVAVLILAAAISTQSNPEVTVQSTSTPAEQPAVVANTAIPTATPFTGEVIRLAWFYKPPKEGELNLIADNFDFFILTHKDEQARDALKAGGLQMPVSQYLLFLTINDADGCDENPPGNQVAFKEGDFCEISEAHPDWFLLNESGDRIKAGKDSYFMDPGNEGFRAFWLERARELQETHGWENIFLDNVEASMAKMRNGDHKVAGYPDDASYQRAVEGFLDYIRKNYFGPRGKPIYGNIVSVAEDPVWDRYVQYMDGALIESFATDWDDRYPDRDNWEEEMSQVERALAQGKTLILVAQGEKDDTELQTFAFASYLLVSNGNTFFRFTNSDSYREIWMYENYNLDLGKPLGPRDEVKNEWRRDFENGYVIVNPQNHKAEIVINP